MNNEIAPVLDILEELKQECKAISKAQAELRTTLAEQSASPKAERTTTQETVQIHLSKETQAKIKKHQLFVLEALSQSSKKLDPKFDLISASPYVIPSFTNEIIPSATISCRGDWSCERNHLN